MKLKPITEKDLDFARKLRNDNREYFFNQEIIRPLAQLNWFMGILGTLDYWFYIIWDKKRVGTISYKLKDGIGEVGNVVIDKKYRKKGYLKLAFEELLKLHKEKMCLKVIPTNINAILAYEALGFKEKERILWK